MGLRIVVVGIAGVGKSTVVAKSVSSIEGASLAVFGTAMFEAGKRLKWVEHRDEMRKLPVEKQKRLQKIAAEKISRSKGRVVFVDTHLFIRTPEGFWPGLPYVVILALKPTHLVLIEASPEEILARRTNDKSRYRDLLTVDEVQTELTLARTFLSAASLVSGAPISFIHNQEGKADEAAELMRKIVSSAGK
ncbi:MAG: adenylate kinase [Thaumarchaeota archaeon]|nr:adenylate kinase [Nitrososphaerota archaeon]